MPRKRPQTVTTPLAEASPISLSWTVLLAAAIFLLTRGYILFFFEPWNSDAANTYFIYASKAYDAGFVPYGESLKIEYPPLGWWTIYTPRLLAPGHITEPTPEQWTPVWKEYVPVFRGLMFICDVGSAVLLVLIARKRCPALQGWSALTYTVTTAILAHLLYDRLDMGLLFLLMAWAFCWLRSLEESGHSIAWSTAAYALLGLSISYKLIPIICVPFVVLADWRYQQQTKRFLLALGVLILAVGLPFLIQFAISGSGVFHLLKYHEERGIQIESLYSTLMMIGSLFGWPVFVDKTHGAFELAGDLSTLMTALSNVLLCCFLAGLFLWALLRRSGYSRRDAYRTGCFALAGAVIASKVLSPQYFVWAIPICLLLALEVLPRRRAVPWIMAILLVAIVALTTWIFPYHYVSEPGSPGLLPPGPAEAANLNLVPCMVVSVRNLLYLGIVIWLGVMLFRRAGDAGARGNRQLA